MRFKRRAFPALGSCIQVGAATSRTRGRNLGGGSDRTERNFSFFGAPVGLVFTIDRRLKPHSWIDLGLFAQNVMIAAKARGIDTCPQVAFAPFHDVIATHLNLPPAEVTAFGMSMGYGDPDAEVNQAGMPRERVHDFARLVGFPESLH